MKVTLEPTDKLVTLNGVPARIWQGETDAGTPIHAFITRIAVPDDHPEECDRFAVLLGQELAPPRPEVAAIPARLVL